MYVGLWPITHAGRSRAVGRVISDVSEFVFVCLSMCPHFKRKTAPAINTKLGAHVG